jgi:hypothetical protein
VANTTSVSFFLAHCIRVDHFSVELPSCKTKDSSSLKIKAPSVKVITSWVTGISSRRFRGALSMSSKSTCSADKTILELLTSAKMVAAILVVSLTVEMNGPKVSATLPAAAMMPMIDAATLRGSAMICFGVMIIVEVHLEVLDNICGHESSAYPSPLKL